MWKNNLTVSKGNDLILLFEVNAIELCTLVFCVVLLAFSDHFFFPVVCSWPLPAQVANNRQSRSETILSGRSFLTLSNK